MNVYKIFPKVKSSFVLYPNLSGGFCPQRQRISINDFSSAPVGFFITLQFYNFEFEKREFEDNSNNS